MDVSLQNPSSQRINAEIVLPVPEGAVVKGFSFQGSAAETTAKLLTKKEAGTIYNRIVSEMRDPALLEFIGYNLIQSKVFPIEPRGTQKIRISYEHILPRDGNRIDYVLPRSESIECHVPLACGCHHQVETSDLDRLFTLSRHRLEKTGKRKSGSADEVELQY